VSEITAIFWEYVLPENIMLVSFMGVLLAIVEAPGLKKSFKTGFKLSAALFLSGFLGWLITGYLNEGYEFIYLWIFWLTSLFAVYILQKLGELKGEWLGLPKILLVLGPMLGLQWLVWEQGVEYIERLFMITGGVIGFYLAFVLIAAIKEQIKLAETHEIYKKEYTLLIAIGMLTLAVIGFNFV